MKERPILFSAPMVRAILEGRKTQTRRILKPQPANGWAIDTPYVLGRITSPHPKKMRFGVFIHRGLGTDFPECDIITCPYGQPGDRLWVRETWRYTASSLEESRAITEDITSGIAVDWRATYIDNRMKLCGLSREEAEMADDFETWRPSIHMPRWASRILLEVVGVRIERLQDISESDSLAEGVTFSSPVNPGRSERMAREAYADLWNSINGAGSWDANPWVWVIKFKHTAGGAA